MTVSFSKDFQYRNLVSNDEYSPEERRSPKPILIGCIAIALVVICGCAGLVVGLQMGGGTAGLAKGISLPSGSPTTTPTPDRNAQVPLRSKGVMDNGLELSVVNYQRPLKVEGGVALPADQQFILLSVQIVNSKKTGAGIQVAPSDFVVKGDGGLSYDANPKTVTIPKMMEQTMILPAKSLDAELIYQDRKSVV
jgi:hypothetical protein